LQGSLLIFTFLLLGGNGKVLLAMEHFFFLSLKYIKFLQTFHGQPIPTTVPAAPHPPAMRPRVRARRGQATDPHSIAERVSSWIF
jgi:hypothetical protein